MGVRLFKYQRHIIYNENNNVHYQINKYDKLINNLTCNNVRKLKKLDRTVDEKA